MWEQLRSYLPRRIISHEVSWHRLHHRIRYIHSVWCFVIVLINISNEQIMCCVVMQVDLMGVAETVHMLVLNRPLKVSRGDSGWSLDDHHRYHHRYHHLLLMCIYIYTHRLCWDQWWCWTCGFSPQQFCRSCLEGFFPDDSECRRLVDRTHLIQFNQ